ncbi:MAG TPA: GNAT family N-acetyltransferase [Aliidongia sp.]|uniref:GNAT family N-acetyltransferase n=1 Tax=Aliidongia sp. TaxID=1914230 RepID=UPI002DDD3BEE|nr:GNAT family N-acetyltransferase [Aliidongia sp.]HEV2672905.1 GNAT family N-acetyltransferase [Aliidongia sp.]
MTDAFAIRFITEEDGRPLRWTYLRPGMPKGGSIYQAPDSLHVGVFAGDALIGSVSFLLEDQTGGVTAGVWRLRGMITHPDWRGRDAGGRALEFGVAELARRGAGQVWCDGRSRALPFYRRHGFHAVGAEFETPGTGPHYRLIRPLVGEIPTPLAGAPEELP